jgi:hypothetical protein
MGKMCLASIFMVSSKMQCADKEYKRFAMRFEGCASLCMLKFFGAFSSTRFFFFFLISKNIFIKKRKAPLHTMEVYKGTTQPAHKTESMSRPVLGYKGKRELEC